MAAARRHARTQAEAEDIAQEAIMRAWRHRASCRTDRAAWLRTITRNEALRAFRVDEVDVDDVSETEDVGGREALEQVALRIDVERELATLSADDQAVLALRFGDDLKHPDVAARMGISEGAVRVRLHRALQRLRAGLS